MAFRRGLRVVAIAGVVAALGAAASVPRTGFGLEEDIGLPWLFRVRGPRPPPPEAVVVRFDRDALARFRALPAAWKEWPQPLAGCAARQSGIEGLADATGLERLPRGVQACLVEELTRRGAAVLAFDLGFRRDPSRESGVPAFAAAVRAHGRVVLLDVAVRELLGGAQPLSAQASTIQADVLEGPHATLAAAAIATASFLLPRGSSLEHQVWAFNRALPNPTQLPVRVLEVLAVPALERLAEQTAAPPPVALAPMERLARFTGWFKAQIAADGGIRDAELARLSPDEARAVRALARVYRGPSAYYLNF
jgi:adenylate cyclase